MAAQEHGEARVQAEETLRQFQEGAPPAFVQAMCAQLVGEDKPLETRQLAGLMLKNTLTAKDKSRRLEAQQRWSTLDAAAREGVKHALVGVLGSAQRQAVSAAAQVISKIAAIEFPHKMWPGLIQSRKEVLSGNDQHTSLFKPLVQSLAGDWQSFKP